MATLGLRLWTVEEYYRMAEVGILTSQERVELLEGQIIVKSGSPACAAANAAAADYLWKMLCQKGFIRLKAPLRLNSYSEVEPDIAVVRFDPQRYNDRPPTPEDVFLVVEIADPSLEKYCFAKTYTYAKAGIADCWIVDAIKRQIHVFRQPGTEGYQQETVFDEYATASPLAFPDIKLHGHQLFP